MVPNRASSSACTVFSLGSTLPLRATSSTFGTQIASPARPKIFELIDGPLQIQQEGIGVKLHRELGIGVPHQALCEADVGALHGQVSAEGLAGRLPPHITI